MPCPLEVADVTDVEDVETAVGRDDFLTARLRGAHDTGYLGGGKDAFRSGGFWGTLRRMSANERLFASIFRRHTVVVEKSIALLPNIERAARLILRVLKGKKKVLVCGNGGSAADSQHFAAELVGHYSKDRRALPAVALTTDSSALTSIGNDYGFEEIFSRQVEALGEKGDVLIAISTSGSSKNVLNAIAAARKKKMHVIVLTGEKGKALQKRVDVAIVVPSKETARIQEVHELVYHAWCEYIDANL